MQQGGVGMVGWGEPTHVVWAIGGLPLIRVGPLPTYLSIYPDTYLLPTNLLHRHSPPTNPCIGDMLRIELS